MPMLDLNEIAVQKEIGSQPGSEEEEENESDLEESLFEEGSNISKDSKYQKIDSDRRNEIFEQQKKSFKARMMGAKQEAKELAKAEAKGESMKPLQLEGIARQDFNDEFMEKVDEFSESWRKAAQKLL